MLFSSITFLYVFLPVLAVYYLVPQNWRNHVLLIASLLFYFVGEPVYVLLLIVSISVGKGSDRKTQNMKQLSPSHPAPAAEGK